MSAAIQSTKRPSAGLVAGARLVTDLADTLGEPVSPTVRRNAASENGPAGRHGGRSPDLRKPGPRIKNQAS